MIVRRVGSVWKVSVRAVGFFRIIWTKRLLGIGQTASTDYTRMT